jgi:hypothetical protein
MPIPSLLPPAALGECCRQLWGQYLGGWFKLFEVIGGEFADLAVFISQW